MKKNFYYIIIYLAYFCKIGMNPIIIRQFHPHKLYPNNLLIFTNCHISRELDRETNNPIRISHEGRPATPCGGAARFFASSR